MFRENFFQSLKNQQLKGQGICNFGLRVTLTDSSNPYIQYPAEGVLVIKEQGVDLSILVAVFHRLESDGRLCPPVEVKYPEFEVK